MKVYVTRSATILHGSPSCPGLAGKPSFTLDDADAAAAAARCTHRLCVAAFVRWEARAT